MIDFLQVFTELGGGPLTSVILLIFMLDLQNRWRVIYYSLLVTMTVFIISFFKMIYEEDRPNWLDPSLTIGQFDCVPEYGNPSGHSLEAAAVSFTLYLDLMMGFSTRSKKKYLWIYSILFGIFPVAYSFTMGFSRIVLGVHTWNQVIYGWLLGIWLAFLFTFGVRRRLKKHVSTKLSKLSDKRKMNREQRRCKNLAVTFMLAIVLYGIYIVVFQYKKRDIQSIASAQALSNIYSQCDESFDINESFQVAVLKEFSYSVGFFGAELGFIFQLKYFDGQDNVTSPAFNKTAKFWGRLLFLIVISAPFEYLVIFSSSSEPLNVVFPKRFIGLFVWQFLLTLLFDFLCMKVKLYDRFVSVEVAANSDEGLGRSQHGPERYQRRNNPK